MFVLCLLTATTACTQPLVTKVKAFRTAVKGGDTETAASYLAADPRVWFGEKEGPGHPLTLAGGPWRHWDRIDSEIPSERRRARRG